MQAAYLCRCITVLHRLCSRPASSSFTSTCCAACTLSRGCSCLMSCGSSCSSSCGTCCWLGPGQLGSRQNFQWLQNASDGLPSLRPLTDYISSTSAVDWAQTESDCRCLSHTVAYCQYSKAGFQANKHESSVIQHACLEEMPCCAGLAQGFQSTCGWSVSTSFRALVRPFSTPASFITRSISPASPGGEAPSWELGLVMEADRSDDTSSTKAFTCTAELPSLVILPGVHLRCDEVPSHK